MKDYKLCSERIFDVLKRERFGKADLIDYQCKDAWIAIIDSVISKFEKEENKQ